MGIIVIEGGGTHTRAAQYDGQGKVVAECSGGASNPVSLGVSASVASIAGLVQDCCAPTDSSADLLFAALAGAANTAIQEAVAEGLAALLPETTLWISTDLHPLLYANCHTGPGILAIAGTGSAVLASNISTKAQRLGGRGTLFGDEGSSYAIGKAALRACARAIDGVGRDTILTTSLPAQVGLKHFEAFVNWEGAHSKRSIAALSLTVAEAAAQGDPVAACLIDEEAQRLAALVISAQKRLGLPPNVQVYEYGGLLDHCARYRDAFRDAIHRAGAMQPMPCALRGTEALYTTAKTRIAPDWVFVKEPAASPQSAPLPDTEALDQSQFIDTLTTAELVAVMQRANETTAAAVGAAHEAIGSAITYAADSIRSGGRILYAGAGTSGRLGVLDASECPPTFGVSPERVHGMIAGGDTALRDSVEGAEDDRQQGAAEAEALQISARDFVIGIAASGATPYVEGVLSVARASKARTALITSNPGAPILCDLLIALKTGAEILAGSTRLKAGTAAKMALNMITTGAFTQSGYVYKGRMIGMIPANDKLRRRAARIVADISQISEAEGAAFLAQSNYHIATAILMACRNLSHDESKALLDKHEGKLRDALNEGAAEA